MRFTLLTLTLMTLWVALAFLVIQRWSPWIPDRFPTGETSLPEKEFEKRYATWLQNPKRYESPDGTRNVYPVHGSFFTIISETKSGNMLWMVPPAHGFLDDDHLLVMDLMSSESAPGSFDIQLWKRRRPEWWWGHLSRAELWAFSALSIFLSFRAGRAAWKRGTRIKATSPLPAVQMVGERGIEPPL